MTEQMKLRLELLRMSLEINSRFSSVKSTEDIIKDSARLENYINRGKSLDNMIEDLGQWFEKDETEIEKEFIKNAE